jgi:DNA invertase Pin-like site-specific DNA recombinase
MEGVAIAKKKGKYRGRKPMLTDEKILALKDMVAKGEKKTDVARHFKMSRETLYRYLST